MRAARSGKRLSEYMEVVGYRADAPRWVYRQAIQPSAWNSDELITLAEIRKIHHRTHASVGRRTAP